MVYLMLRDATNTPLSSTAIIAIAAGAGALLLCGIIVPVVLLVRARQNHKRFIADLEKRGIYLTQARDEAAASVARPRNVLRRNTVLPFDAKSGWGALQSSETLQSGAAPSTVAHYVPPKPLHSMKRAGRLSWPFSSKRPSGHSVQMQKLKGSRLSTVIEDPKHSALVPILGSTANQSRLSVATSTGDVSVVSSSQSLLRHHPAFRSVEKVPQVPQQAPDRSYFRANANKRLSRARSMDAVPKVLPAPELQPQILPRSSSSCQISGKAPDIILPPLPSDLVRIQSEEDLRRNHLKHVLSKSSVSSAESADTTILASRLSPIIPRATKARAQRINKPTSGPRPFRDTLDLRAKTMSSKGNANSNVMRSSSTPHFSSQAPRSPHRSNRPANTIVDTSSGIKRAQSVISDAGPYPTASPLRLGNTSKRRSKTFVSCSGSPERQGPSGNYPRNLTGAMKSPKRQHSQTSSRSSGGNPFQWDMTPLSPSMKPSALKGSPGARQGHHRKNSVRISLVPTFHGPPSRGASSTLLGDAQEPPKEIDTESTTKSGLCLTGITGENPAPPSSRTFSPDLTPSATTLQASLTTTSSTLPLVAYDDSFVVFPTDQILPDLSVRERNRLSNGSIFGLSQFPATPSVIEPLDFEFAPFPDSLSGRYATGEQDPQTPGTPYLTQGPFASNQDNEHSDGSVTAVDGYDPERPGLVFQTPPQATGRPYQSICTPIPEESSMLSNNTTTMERAQRIDSPPISPKSPSPLESGLGEKSTYNLPVRTTSIHEAPLETVNPAMLCKDSFAVVNSSLDNVSGSRPELSYNFRSEDLATKFPTSNMFTQPTVESHLAPTSLFGPQSGTAAESPILGHNRISQASSVYSIPSPPIGMSPEASSLELPNPVMPAPPRPSHAQLPDQRLSINFAELPRLAPSPSGPRGSPPRPLRSSIAALRRMNSDCMDVKNGKPDRGERRYLRFGRQSSVQLAGEESWLEDVEDSNDNVDLDDAKGRRLVGSVLDEWEEGSTMLSLGNGTIKDSPLTMKPAANRNLSHPTSFVDHDTSAGATDERASSIWEDSEVFWSSNTPPPPSSTLTSQAKENNKNPIASSPLITSMTSLSTPTTTPTRKRRSSFQVAKDKPYNSPSNNPSPTRGSPTENTNRYQDMKTSPVSSSSSPRRQHRDHTGSPTHNNNNSSRRMGTPGRRYRKRNILGVGTPNVRIQVTSPGGHVVGTGNAREGVGSAVNWGTGVLYDSQGFLRY